MAEEKDFNMLVGAKFKLLGASETAIFSKDKEGYSVLLAPSETEENKGITIKELVTQVNDLIKNFDSKAKAIEQSEIEGKIDAVAPKDESGKSKFDITNLKVILNQAFLYMKSQDKTLEYAFSLTIDSKEVIPEEITFLNVENVTFSIWNTTRSKVIEKMALITPETYLV
ncbi:hypothetical protein [uncultured Clostridium sp.]|uniref:hypothetical protein n=1 Tax=uncultured Clostridium sp. TaxID=59620 RepID=UPI0025F47A35|nr:hypothetical protein [uncultured Clostridium sp.]